MRILEVHLKDHEACSELIRCVNIIARDIMFANFHVDSLDLEHYEDEGKVIVRTDSDLVIAEVVQFLETGDTTLVRAVVLDGLPHTLAMYTDEELEQILLNLVA